MKLIGLMVLLQIITGCTAMPVPDKMDLSASAGSYHELSESIQSSGSLNLRIKLNEISNGTNWAPGAMISFAKDSYENTIIFTVYQKEPEDKFLTAGYRYAVNDKDVFFRDLPKTYAIGSSVDLTVKWEFDSGFHFSFSGQPEITFKPEFQVNKVLYSISSGSGVIEKL